MLRAIRTRSVQVKSLRCYSTEGLLKTPLYQLNKDLGGRMVPYAGFEMPVMFKSQTHIESHHWVRKEAGLFDVSHMLQHRFSGRGSTAFLEKITPADLTNMKPFTFTLSVLLNEKGGVIDDCIITKHGEDEFYMVTNAGCRQRDLEFIEQEKTQFPGASNFEHKPFEGTLLALQGPKASKVLQRFTDYDLSSLVFGTSQFINLNGFCTDKIHTARSGYTGEDGFEISIPNDASAVEFAKALVELEEVAPIGLAARDSLRLEAGMCLYGHELSEELTPVDAALGWLIPKTRRTTETATFNGAEKILAQLNDRNLVPRTRIGIVSTGPAPRDGTKIFNTEGQEVGVVTSGSASPTLGGNVAQAYINRGYNKSGTKLQLEIRNKYRAGEVKKLPFVVNNFYRG